jgi:hypothetical protein
VLSVLPALDLHMVPAISLAAMPGTKFQLEYTPASGPMNAWVPLALITITNNPQFYFDVSAIGQPARFYRLVEVPVSEVKLSASPAIGGP